ncbi:DNA-3-methyladenine glycosylase 2 family protein [Actinocorallia sp. API 0066]|uniref:DNA-3-methyladenine glycosylase family protein n=1 Tax=Actinocorallia sp. API 0066 TaxID=2896846 RepID=UPI001E382DDF|nr:DNA-3-methyladenine glycosylase 2 family protein [Actinocorallia sp. API 0066]MCD0451187.1 DNA-3-methyladenine glycosylase 2 family protein [Actinocorallia sp. API 0066]
MPTRVWEAPWPVRPRRTLAVYRRGPHDPAYRVTPDGTVWRASRTPEGPGALAVSASGGRVEAEAWGPGAEWLLESLPALLGAEDEPERLVPVDDVVKDAARRFPFRIARSGLVFEALVPAVLEQKVPGAEAWRAWGYLLRRFGEPAPGVPELRVPPPPEVWARIPSWEWHRAGAEAVRGRTIIGAARARLEREPGEGPVGRAEGAAARLGALPGVGPWTVAEVRQRALGDPDAVSVGDYNLPGIVGWAFLGRKVDDATMLELLEPYRGQRYRVTTLLQLAGHTPPKRGPRLSVRDYRGF